MTDANLEDSARPAAGRGGAGGLLSVANAAQAAKMAALLLFLLPWVTVSCAEQELVQLSGLDLAQGSATVTNPFTGETMTPPKSGDPDLPVMIGAILIALAFLAGFLRRRWAPIVSSAALAAAASLIIYSVLWRLPQRAREDVTAESASGISEAQIADLLRIDVAVGFWLTLAALAAAILLTLLSRTRSPSGRG